MCRKLAHFASIVVLVGLLSPLAMAFDEIYDFDGLADPGPGDFNEDGTVDGLDFLKWQEDGLSQSDLADWEANYGTFPADPTDWMTSENWSDSGFDPDPNGAFGPPLPDFGTRVEIQRTTYGLNAPVIGPGDAAQAFGVRIGRHGGEEPGFDGTGLLTMTGGTLTVEDRCSPIAGECNSRLRVGAADVMPDEADHRFPGTFDLSGGTVTTDTLWIGSGSHGEMNMSGGVVNTRWNFYFDWTGHQDPFIPLHNESVLNMTGGTINVGTLFGDALRMYRESSLNLDGGEILINGAAELGTQKQSPGSINPPIVEIPDVTVSITAGLLEASNFLQVRGTVVLSGGILRADSFNETDSIGGTVEINPGGLLQFNESQETIAAVEALISSGFFFTTDINGLVVSTVDVSGTFFTQVKVAPPAIMGVPEPSSVVLALLVSVSMVFRGRIFRGKKVGTNQFS